MYLLQLIERVGVVQDPRADNPPSGAYLESFDPEAHNGKGFTTFTSDPDRAMQFDSAIAAMALWRTVPQCRPRREDGQPNRPLTAFTMAIERR